MKPRIYWAPPYVAALIMGALSFPGLVSALTLERNRPAKPSTQPRKTRTWCALKLSGHQF